MAPKTPTKVTNPDINYNLSIRIPGWLKNDVIDLCAELGVSIQQWLSVIVFEAVREGRGLPEAPPAVVALPTQDQVLRSYLVGERLVMPCGRVGECEGLVPRLVDGVGFCGVCGIRVV